MYRLRNARLRQSALIEDLDYRHAREPGADYRPDRGKSKITLLHVKISPPGTEPPGVEHTVSTQFRLHGRNGFRLSDTGLQVGRSPANSIGKATRLAPLRLQRELHNLAELAGQSIEQERQA